MSVFFMYLNIFFQRDIKRQENIIDFRSVFFYF
jgi:hypothetical protein